MGFFSNFFSSFFTAVIGLGLAVATGGISLAGSAWLQAAKVAGIAAAIAGVSATAAELAKPDDPELPDLERSFTFSSGPAQYLIGDDKITGLLTYVSEYYTAPTGGIGTGMRIGGVDGDSLNARRDWIDFLFTLTSHPCNNIFEIYMGGERFRVHGLRSDRERLFTLIRRPDMSWDEWHRINKEYKENVRIYDLLDGDTSQKIKDRLPNNTCEIGGFTQAGFEPAAIFIRVRSDRDFWLNYGFNPRQVGFAVRGIVNNNPVDAVPWFYNRFLGVSTSQWRIDPVVRDWYARNGFRVNGVFNSDQLERAFKSLTKRTIRGSIFYENGFYELKPRMGDAPTKTITQNNLTEPVEHILRQGFKEYANTLSASFKDRSNNYDVSNTGPIRNTRAIAEDGREIHTDLGFFMFETSKANLSLELLRQTHRNENWQEVGMFVKMDNPPQIGERFNLNLSTDRINGIFLCEQRANLLNGVVVLTATHDPDSNYTVGPATLPVTPPTPTVFPISGPLEPENLIIEEEYDYKNGKAVTDLKLRWTNPPRNTGTRVQIWRRAYDYLGVFHPQTILQSVDVEGNTATLQDLVPDTNVFIQLLGLRGELRSTSYIWKRYRIGRPEPDVDGSVVPELVPPLHVLFDQSSSILTVQGVANQYTVSIAVRYALGDTVITPDNVRTGTTPLGWFSVTPGERFTIPVEIPPSLNGFVRFVVRPINAFNLTYRNRGWLTSLYHIQREGCCISKSEEPDWTGTVSRSTNSVGAVSDDLMKFGNSLIIAPNKPAHLLLGSDIVTNNPDVFPFYRKNMGRFTYTSEWIDVPTEFQKAGKFSWRFFLDVFDMLDNSTRNLSGFNVRIQDNVVFNQNPDSFSTSITGSAIDNVGPDGFHASVTRTADNVAVARFRVIVRFPENPDRPLAIRSLRTEMLYEPV